jgi:hypothetical protein
MFGISRQTVYKWLHRFNDGGANSLADRRPIARSFPTRTSFQIERSIERLRRTRRMLSREIAHVNMAHLTEREALVIAVTSWAAVEVRPSSAVRARNGWARSFSLAALLAATSRSRSMTCI